MRPLYSPQALDTYPAVRRGRRAARRPAAGASVAWTAASRGCVRDDAPMSLAGNDQRTARWGLLALAVTVGLLLALPTLASAATATWDGSTGAWSDSTKWSTGIAPGLGDMAVVNSGTVTVDSSKTVTRLTITGGEIIADNGLNVLAVSGVSNFVGTGGVVSGDSNVQLWDSAVFSGVQFVGSGASQPAVLVRDAATIDDDTSFTGRRASFLGATTWSAGTITTNTEVLNVGTFSIAGPVVLDGVGNAAHFENQLSTGKLERVGLGTARMNVPYCASEGLLVVSGGTLELAGGTRRCLAPYSPDTTNGAYSVALGATLRFVDGVFGYASNSTFDAAIGGAGTVEVGGAGLPATLDMQPKTTLSPDSLTVTADSKIITSDGLSRTAGTLTIASTGTVQGNVALNAGVLQGAGTVNGTLSNSGGSVRPGTSPGIFSIDGDYTQGAGGTLAIDVGGSVFGTGYDRLAVTGAASLNGTIALAPVGFAPPADTLLPGIVTAATRTGQFSVTSGAGLTLTTSYAAQYRADGVDLRVVSEPPPPPPPTTPPVTTAPPTVTGPTISVTVLSGPVLVRFPGEKTFEPLTGAQIVPIGSTVDARNGTVSITGSVSGLPVSAQFGGGVFTVRQVKPSKAIDIVLAAPTGCHPAGRGAHAARQAPGENVVRAKERPRKRPRHGAFRTNGRYSSAAALGTKWTTVERCASTTTRVKDGLVRVKDKITGRSTDVRGGQSYTARKAARKGARR